MIPERLTALREEMKRRSIDIYVVPTADFHESEYVGEHFKARKFITGFTGSAGTAVITLKEAGLWTDGRYFVQAEKQLEGSTVTLYRMAEEGVPAVEEFVKDKLPQGGCIGFDGRTVYGAWGEVCGNRRGKERFSFCRGRSDQSDLDRQTGVIQSSIIYTGRKIFRKEHCREDQRCACKDGRGRCRCPHSHEPLRYCMAFEYPWR